MIRLLIATVFVGATAAITNASIPSSPLLKGVRAIVFEGPALLNPLRVTNIDSATDIYVHLTRAVRFGAAVPAAELRSRSCIKASIYFLNARTAMLSDDQVVSGAPDYVYSFFPAAGSRDAALDARGGVRVAPEIRSVLRRAGVPDSVGDHLTMGNCARN